jgi:hypothetical protein
MVANATSPWETKEPADSGAGTQPGEPSSAAGNAEAHVQQIQRLCSPFMHPSMSTGYHLDTQSRVTCHRTDSWPPPHQAFLDGGTWQPKSDPEMVDRNLSTRSTGDSSTMVSASAWGRTQDTASRSLATCRKGPHLEIHPRHSQDTALGFPQAALNIPTSLLNHLACQWDWGWGCVTVVLWLCFWLLFALCHSIHQKPGLWQDFLNRSAVAQETRVRHDQWDCIELKTSAQQRKKQQSEEAVTEWEKSLPFTPKILPERRLMSRKYKEL